MLPSEPWKAYWLSGPLQCQHHHHLLLLIHQLLGMVTPGGKGASWNASWKQMHSALGSPPCCHPAVKHQQRCPAYLAAASLALQDAVGAALL
jgi:hypothetical protein